MKIFLIAAAIFAVALFILWFKGGSVAQANQKKDVESSRHDFSKETLRFVVEKYKPIVEIYLPFYSDLNLELILAMITVESAGEENAVGASGEYGSMQVKPDALADFNCYYSRRYLMVDLFNKFYGVEVGMGYLNLRFLKWKDMNTAIRAYRRGDGDKDMADAYEYLNKIESARSQILGVLMEKKS